MEGSNKEMRIYKNFTDGLDEIKRDLAEMGIDVHPQTMQDKKVADNPDFATKELQNYIYTIIDPMNSIDQLNPTQPWADLEFLERIDPEFVNPGIAWAARKDIWSEFLHNGRFAYTYGERIGDGVDNIIKEIMVRPDSRQLYLGIWDPNIDSHRMGGEQRVPCSLGYLFQVREDKLNMTYFMRSCDYATHMQNDIYLANRLMDYVADHTGYETGNFTHFIGSLHIYNKDIEGVF